MFKHLLLTPLLLFLSATSLGANCLWDNDTLLMERKRFPQVLELMAGKFIRHSPEYHQWRLTDRLEKLKTDPNNLGLLDDLAVSYDKTNQQQKAIELALKMLELKPDRYETLANLGTFYIHAGELEKGVAYIKQAIAINPNAHFGREISQQWLVEFLIENKSTPQKLPLPNFADYCLKRLKAEKPIVLTQDASLKDEMQKMLKGVQGMMFFGKYDSPILLQTCGDLLSWQGWGDIQQKSLYISGDAKMLAARAYLRAAQVLAKEPEVVSAYRALALAALKNQASAQGSDQPFQMEGMEKEMQVELADAERWYEVLRSNEMGWIADKKDVEGEFIRFYSEPPVLKNREPIGKTASQYVKEWKPIWLLGGLSSLAGIGIFWYLVRRVQRQRVLKSADSRIDIEQSNHNKT